MCKYYVYGVLMTLLIASAAGAQTTIQQQLIVTHNAGIYNGQFTVSFYLKGTNLPSPKTLGSMTIDIRYNHTVLNFVDATSWALGSTAGYGRFAHVNGDPGLIRVGCTSMGVNENGDGTLPGFDITTSYQRIVDLNFTIQNTAGYANLAIESSTNQIGLYANHGNNPIGGDIDNQLLSPPTIIQDEPLPVEIASLSAESGHGTVCLTWKTATETDNLGFDVERKSRTQTAGADAWTKVGFVTGAGTSSAVHDYSFTDNHPSPEGTAVYRLKQIDRDGGFSYSDEIEVHVEAPTAYVLAQNYPNPFNPSTTIDFEIPKAGDVRLEIYTILGEKLSDAVHAFFPAGRHRVIFRGDALASGIYFYRLVVNGTTFIKTMHLLK